MLTQAVVFGKFGLVHYGHVSLLEYAKSISDHLVVGIIDDDQNERSFDEMLKSRRLVERIGLADEVQIVENVSVFLKKHKPQLVVKGFEFKEKENPEANIVEQYGGRIVFSNHRTELTYSGGQSALGNSVVWLDRTEIHNYMGDKDLTSQEVFSTTSNLSKIRCCVLGDLIIDKYIHTKPLGLSQEEAAIVVTTERERTYFGGAAVVASLAKEFCSDVSFISLVGEDENAESAKCEMHANGVDIAFLTDFDSKTVTKSKFFVNGHPQIRINQFSKSTPSIDYEKELLTLLTKKISASDLMLFSDFNYGTISTNLISEIISECKRVNCFTSADSQTSSQIGRIGKFFGADLISLTEHEARVELRDFDSNVNALLFKLVEVSTSPYVLLKLGKNGFIAAENHNNEINVYSMNSVNPEPKDVSGAGDIMLVVCSLALVSGASFPIALLLANVAAGVQISRIGHHPIRLEDLKNWI